MCVCGVGIVGARAGVGNVCVRSWNGWGSRRSGICVECWVAEWQVLSWNCWGSRRSGLLVWCGVWMVGSRGVGQCVVCGVGMVGGCADGYARVSAFDWSRESMAECGQSSGGLMLEAANSAVVEFDRIRWLLQESGNLVRVEEWLAEIISSYDFKWIFILKYDVNETIKCKNYHHVMIVVLHRKTIHSLLLISWILTLFSVPGEPRIEAKLPRSESGIER
ncbi:hypothetical protein HNY73_008097 [Argiope bruennichi]|uniref:Uncharacterized protein n=1 Tax=Argiope bruennichi TaxID=94029 RepID=A0A8T0F597_ARGBR|nr:hypothetical protein HNY73_008097 [Argiope bruennichi]